MPFALILLLCARKLTLDEIVCLWELADVDFTPGGVAE
jgi:hypothetical protein